MTDLDWIIENCLGSVSIEVNEHRVSYQTVSEYLDSREAEPDEIPAAIRIKAQELERIVCVRAYPTTTIGSYTFYDFDWDRCVTRMRQFLETL